MKEKYNDMDREIIHELYKAVKILGGRGSILSTIGSYKNTMPDKFILDGLKIWNNHYAGKIKEDTDNPIYTC